MGEKEKLLVEITESEPLNWYNVGEVHEVIQAKSPYHYELMGNKGGYYIKKDHCRLFSKSEGGAKMNYKCCDKTGITNDGKYCDCKFGESKTKRKLMTTGQKLFDAEKKKYCHFNSEKINHCQKCDIYVDYSKEKCPLCGEGKQPFIYKQPISSEGILKSNEQHFLNHPLYIDAQNYWNDVQRHQILKGMEKYDEPLNHESWTGEDLIDHAMQENVDQAHYLTALREKVRTTYKIKDKQIDFLKAKNNQLEKDNEDLRDLVDKLQKDIVNLKNNPIFRKAFQDKIKQLTELWEEIKKSSDEK